MSDSKQESRSPKSSRPPSGKAVRFQPAASGGGSPTAANAGAAPARSGSWQRRPAPLESTLSGSTNLDATRAAGNEDGDSPLLNDQEREEIFGPKPSAAPEVVPSAKEIAAAEVAGEKAAVELAARASAQLLDAAADAQTKLAFAVTVETQPLPAALPPPPAAVPIAGGAAASGAIPGRAAGKMPGRMAGATVGEAWQPGAELVVCCCTWNMANAMPAASQVKQLIRPNAHVICVGTQENGPYVGLNTQHRAWERLLEVECLQERYTKVAAQTLWAIHITVFVRTTDVLPYVEFSETSFVKTGSLKSLMGNKGGVGAAIVLSLKGTGAFKDYHRLPVHHPSAAPASGPSGGGEGERTALQAAFEQQDTKAKQQHSRPPSASIGGTYSPREGADGSSAGSSAPLAGGGALMVDYGSNSGLPGGGGAASAVGAAQKFTILFISAHLAAHQKEIEARNRDFRRIVAAMPLGCRSPARKWRRFFLRSNGGAEGALALPDDFPSPADASSSNDEARNATAAVLKSAPKNAPSRQRDVTEEFDVAIFLGDLNYRINGTKRAIENIIANHVALRPVLIQNDQLTREMAKGFVFTRFQEGPLCFRPTYKYHIDKATKAATDEYDLSKKARLPAYCDRVLFKKHPTFDGDIVLTHYTDVPVVRTSDHRPVVAMFKFKTKMCAGGVDDGTEDDDDGAGCCSCCC